MAVEYPKTAERPRFFCVPSGEAEFFHQKIRICFILGLSGFIDLEGGYVHAAGTKRAAMDSFEGKCGA
jgi:hypothetical protein